MKILITTAILIFTLGVYSQSTPDYSKIAKACELWGLIKYFHPDNPGSSFDSAFAASIPKMLTAVDDNEWKNILGQWLGVINDPNTNVKEVDTTILSNGNIESEFMKDSSLYIRISGGVGYGDYWAMMNIINLEKEKLNSTNTDIIIDLRQEGNLNSTEYLQSSSSLYFENMDNILSTDIVPYFKSRYYSGFPSEQGVSSGGYTKNDVLQHTVRSGDFQERNQHVVYIINKYSELPIIALSQQAAGVAIIISDTECLEHLFPLSYSIDISENISVNLKTREILFLNGFQPVINYIYDESENPIKIAKDLLKDTEGDIWNLPVYDTKTSNEDITNSYPENAYPSVGFRVLAAAKIFTVIENFFPYYDLMDEDWRQSFIISLKDFINAKDDADYGLAIAKLYSNIDDSHGFVQGKSVLINIYGEAPPPFLVDIIEGNVVVTGILSDSICQEVNISIGDIIYEVDGILLEELIQQKKKYLTASREESKLSFAAWFCVRGSESKEVVFIIQDGNANKREVKITWSNSYFTQYKKEHKLDTIELINKNIGYADLTRMQTNQTDSMFEKFKNTKAIIFDMRGYPNGTAWTIAPRLTEKENVPLAKFNKPEIFAPYKNEGGIISSRSYTEFVQTVEKTDLWKYKGKTIMLIDHNAVSQAEHTGLFFETVSNTVFIGSPTAGANGDVTSFKIPGGITLRFTGQGVTHADGRQLQRIGLQPHIEVRPTIDGIRKGKDEVLEKAIEWIEENVQ